MNTIRLLFEETVKYEHELIIETDLTEDEVIELLDKIDYNMENFDG